MDRGTIIRFLQRSLWVQCGELECGVGLRQRPNCETVIITETVVDRSELRWW
jgi:hypothetical protein